MLERLEDAFAERQRSEDRLRRFVSDASHELRTPLTSIRGYAELFRRGADQRPEDLAVAMRRIEEESVRMGRLVDELLLLARLDEAPAIERRPVDVARRGRRGGRRQSDGARARRSFEGPPDAFVSGDEARIRQAIGNLVTNALTHTAAPAAVSIRVVADDGRSHRGERHRTRARSGDGRACLRAVPPRRRRPLAWGDRPRAGDRQGGGRGSGGSVTVASSPGSGTTFTLRLPS